jgi:isopentenyl diphosphate isomerase/L-lactate dehydrogenase-like FMN-dependent dehydrogenase
MNTWFTDIVKDANERTLSDQELERIMVYYSGMPARLRAAEEVEQLEGELASTLYVELKKAHPKRTLYTRRFVQDALEGLRPMTQAMLADEPRLFRHRWLHHLTRVIDELQVDPAEVWDVYARIRQRAAERLSHHSRELLDPYFDELADALAATPALAH